MTIKTELEELFHTDDLLTVHAIVEWAHDHPASGLYHELKCDDDEAAAALWRLHHARRLIAIHVIDDSHYRQTVSLSVDRAAEGGYRMLENILANKSLYDIALSDALADFERMRVKYEHLRELQPIWNEVKKVRRLRAGQAQHSSAQRSSA